MGLPPIGGSPLSPILAIIGGKWAPLGWPRRVSVGGTSDATLYGTFSGSPNSAGWIFEFAYLPFSHDGPAFWPWLNFRIGLQYTHWTKFDEATTNIDGMGRNASGNNTFFAYIWTMF